MSDRRMKDGDLPQSITTRIEAEARRVDGRGGAGRARKVLVVGGSGYIGCPVTNHLISMGLEVRNLDRLVYNHASAMIGQLATPGYEFMFGDMGDPDALDAALDGVSDVVILGGLVGDPITKKFPEQSAEINDRAITTCIDTLNGRNLNKVIFVSTCSNYGMIGDNEMADENFALTPLSLYARAKVAAEEHLLSLAGKVDYSPTVLRFATAFGLAPRMRFDLTVNEFARELYLDRGLVVYDAHTWRPYCHVRDFARLIGRVLTWPVEDVAFEVFNAGSDANNYTKQAIVDLVLARLPGRRVDYKANSSDPRNYRVSFEKVRTRLLFEPRTSVADGVDEILWAMRAHLFDDVDKRETFYGNYALPALMAA